MDGVKMELLLGLLNKWLIKRLVWQNVSLLFDAVDCENQWCAQVIFVESESQALRVRVI